MSSLYYRVQNGGWWLVLEEYLHCFGRTVIMILFSIILHYGSWYSKDTVSHIISWSEVFDFKWLAVSILTLFFDTTWISVMDDLFWMFYICFTLHAGVLIYIPFWTVLHVLQHLMTRKGARSFKSVSEMCLAFGLCVCFLYPRACVCMGLQDTFPCIAMHAHSVHQVMVIGRMLSKWSMLSSASSWIQIFTNGFPESNLSKWTVIIILDLPHP